MQEIELFEDSIHAALMNPGVGAIGGDDPEPFNLTLVDGFDDLVVGEAVCGGNIFKRDLKD